MKEFLSRQYPNLILWAPFIMAAGMALYFALPAEPAIAAPWLMAALCAACVLMVARRRNTSPFILTVSLAAALLPLFGFFYAAAYSGSIRTPTIPRDIRAAVISGTVADIDYTADRTRILIKETAVTLPYSTHPAEGGEFTVRLTISGDAPPPKIGDRIKASGALFKPGPADMPGGFDMAEWAYFKGISATGWTDKITVVAPADGGNSIAALRDDIRNRVAAHGNERATALAASLMLGYSRAMPDADNALAKAAGIAHVFSISGFHMTLIGGWLFAFFYFLARPFAPLARRFPVRNIAIVPTVAALCFYLVLSGAGVATQRSLVMALIGFLAIAFARNLFSTRGAALVFGGLLLLNPHYVTQAGFQLSFSAVFGILWLFRDRKFEHKTLWQKIKNGAVSAAKIDMVATLFTAPFIAYHFYNVPLYSLLGNMFCLPIFSLAIMPLTLTGTITAMFGFFAPLDWAAHAYGLVLNITAWIAGLPGAVAQTPAIPGPALALMTLALLCLVLIINVRRSMNIIFAGVVALCALGLVATRQRPAFYATHDHELVAFKKDDGTLQFNKGRASNHKMAFDAWENSNWTSTPESRKPIRKGFDGEKYSAKCDDKACFYTTPTFSLAYIQQFVPLARNIEELCRSGKTDFIVVYFNVSAPNCKAEILRGGLAIYESGRVEHVPAGRVWHNINNPR